MHKHCVSLRWNQWALWICSYQIGSDLGQVNPQKPTCLLARHAFVSGTQGGLTLDPATCASCVASCALTLHRWDETWSPGSQDVMLGISWDFKIQTTSCKFRCVWRWPQICYGVWYLKNELLVVVILPVKCAYPQLYSWIISIPRSWSSTHEWQHTNASINWHRCIGVMSRFSTPASILLDLQVIRASDCKTWSHC